MPTSKDREPKREKLPVKQELKPDLDEVKARFARLETQWIELGFPDEITESWVQAVTELAQTHLDLLNNFGQEIFQTSHELYMEYWKIGNVLGWLDDELSTRRDSTETWRTLKQSIILVYKKSRLATYNLIDNEPYFIDRKLRHTVVPLPIGGTKEVPFYELIQRTPESTKKIEKGIIVVFASNTGQVNIGCVIHRESDNQCLLLVPEGLKITFIHETKTPDAVIETILKGLLQPLWSTLRNEPLPSRGRREKIEQKIEWQDVTLEGTKVISVGSINQATGTDSQLHQDFPGILTSPAGEPNTTVVIKTTKLFAEQFDFVTSIILSGQPLPLYRYQDENGGWQYGLKMPDGKISSITTLQATEQTRITEMFLTREDIFWLQGIKNLKVDWSDIRLKFLEESSN